ncbi:MAG: gamma-glutamyltransferase [Alphaproteobacteria bacterium]|nr:MAG: gamma-glutamyltransferase [Alphaproteobacteria bacterium]
MSPNRSVHKATVRAGGGMVASQHRDAARVGAEVLARGGNAVDAAIATSFALNVFEPWMSGIGGGGLMVIREPSGAVHALDCGMASPAALDPADYPVVPGVANDLFPWAAVEGDRNVTGPLAVAVPGLVAGLGLAHERFARLGWAALVAPSVALSETGLPVDWYATMMIGHAARGLARWGATAERFLPGGHPPAIPLAPGVDSFLPAPALTRTLRMLAEDGAEGFYRGRLADLIARDAASVGARLTADDLAGYRARMQAPLEIGYRTATIWATPELSAGPTLADTLGRMQAGFTPAAAPDAGSYAATAAALKAAYARRLAEMGDVEGGRSIGCTSHLSVIDRDGMAVALTQTLLSVFGSMVTLPQTGILMNNGIFWFDPEPGRPNSLGPSKRCLANMCPVVLQTGDGRLAAIGASGGRRILPAVTQLTSFLTDFGMDLETALHQPRIDMSGGPAITADPRLPDDTLTALAAVAPVIPAHCAVFPHPYANISAVTRRDGQCEGGSEPVLPWGDAVAEAKVAPAA